jgi:hypothetical protein
VGSSSGGAITGTAFKNLTTAGGEAAFGVVPAVRYGATQHEYLIGNDEYQGVLTGTNTGDTLNLFAIDFNNTTPVLTAVDMSVSQYFLPNVADQPGANSSVFTGDATIQNAFCAPSRCRGYGCPFETPDPRHE